MCNKQSKIIPIYPTASIDVVVNTYHKIREQFYDWSHMESQFYTYDEKTDMIVDMVYYE